MEYETHSLPGRMIEIGDKICDRERFSLAAWNTTTWFRVVSIEKGRRTWNVTLDNGSVIPIDPQTSIRIAKPLENPSEDIEE